MGEGESRGGGGVGNMYEKWSVAAAATTTTSASFGEIALRARRTDDGKMSPELMVMVATCACAKSLLP